MNCESDSTGGSWLEKLDPSDPWTMRGPWWDTPDETPVPHWIWNPSWNLPHSRSLIRWEASAVRAVFETDVLLRWGKQYGPKSGRGGFILKRDGQVVATVTTWIS